MGVLDDLAVTTANRAGILDQLAQGVRMDPAVTKQMDADASASLGEFGKALRRAGYSTAASGQAFVGQMAEPFAPGFARTQISEALGTLRNMPQGLAPRVENWSDINNLSDFGDKVLSAAGEGIPSSLTALGAGLLTRGAATRLGLSPTMAGFVGGTVGGTPFEGGETALQLQQDERAMAHTSAAERAALTLGRGLFNAGAESYVPNVMVAPRLLGQAKRVAPGFGNAVRNTALAGLEGGVGEFGTGAVQDVSGQVAMNIAKGTSGIDPRQAIEAGLTEAVGGVGFGTVGGVAQGLHSNIGAATDKVVEKGKQAASSLPTTDDVIGKLRQFSTDPEAFGRDVGTMTLGAIDKMAEGAGVMKDYVAKGADKAGSLVEGLRAQVERHVAKNIKDPELRDWWLDQTANLGSVTAGEWKLFKDALNADSGKEFVEGATMAGRMVGNKIIDGAKSGWDTLGKVWDSAAETISNGKAKPSFDTELSINERKAFREDQHIQKALSQFEDPQERTQVEQVLKHGYINSAYFQNEDPKSPQNQFAKEFEEKTGYNLNGLLESVRSGQRDVQTSQLVSKPVDTLLHESNVDLKHKDRLIELAKKQEYDALTPTEKRWLTTISKNDPAELSERRDFLAKAQGAESFAALTPAQKKKVDALAGKDAGASMRGQSFFNKFVKTTDEYLRGAEQASPMAGVSGWNTVANGEVYNTDGGNAVIDGKAQEVDKPMRSPFDHEAFKQSMIDSTYGDPEKYGDSQVPVSLTSQDDRVTSKMIAKMFGKRVGKDSFVNLTPKEMGQVKDGKPLEMKLNPMSLAAMVKDKQFRDAFAEHLPEYDDRKGADQMSAESMASALNVLHTQGLEVDPEVFGLPPGDPIKIKVNADFSKLSPETIIRRTGGRTFRIRDWTGETERMVAQNKQLEFLGSFEGDFKALSALAKKDLLADKIRKIVYARVMDGHEKNFRPSKAVLDNAMEAYKDALPQLIKDRETRTKLADERMLIADAFRSGDLTRADVEALTTYYSEGGGGNFKTLLKTLGNVLGKRPITSKHPMAKEHAAKILDMITDIEQGQEEFDNNKYGRGDMTIDALAEEFKMYKLAPLERANTEAVAQDVRKARSGSRAGRKEVKAAAKAAKNTTQSTPAAPNEAQVVGDITKQINAAQNAEQLAAVKIPDTLTAGAKLNLQKKVAAKMNELSAREIGELTEEPAAPAPVKEGKVEAPKAETKNAAYEAKVAANMAKVEKAKERVKQEQKKEEAAPKPEKVEAGPEWTETRDDKPFEKPEAKAETSKQETSKADPQIDAAKKAGRERVQALLKQMFGDRVKALFDSKMVNEGAVGEYQSYADALESARESRRFYLEEAKKDWTKRVDELSDKEVQKRIAYFEKREQAILADKAVLGYVRLAAGMEQRAGLAEHESFHAAFDIYFKATPEERRVITTAFTRGTVIKQLMARFKDNDKILNVIDPKSKNFDPEEAAAYGFQLWYADPEAIKLGEQTKTIFSKIAEFVRKLFGILTPEEKALLILNDLKNGTRAEKGVSPIARVLDKDRPWTERAQHFAQEIGGLLKSGYDMLLTPVHTRLVETGNPILKQIADRGYLPTGDEGNTGGMIQRTMSEQKRWMNAADRIFKGLTEAELKELHDAKIFDKEPTDPKLKERWNQLNELYKNLYDYQATAGVALKNAAIESNYYPLTWDPEKVLKDKEAFLAMLTKPEYKSHLATAKKTPNEIWEGITAYLERGEDLVNVMGNNGEPITEHTKTRTLAFIDKADRRPFMTDDPLHTTVRYIKQAVRQAEYVRSYGVNGRELNGMLATAATEYGATKEQIALARDYIDGLMGNKEIGMSRELKDLYGAMTVYQNFRLLPFSLFSSLVDPLGIAVRSNSIGDAFETFTYSMKNLFKEFKKDYTRDEWEALAEDWGIIEDAGTTINAQNMYEGVTLRGKTKELNDTLFRYNLLNGWIRNNTIMATKAAQRFFYRASEGMFKEHSARYLEEVGLSKEDIIYDEKLGRILLHANELQAAGKSEAEAKATETKLRNATEKFVRQALLNPTSAEMPNWASNPYLMPIAHLKQFVWAFNMTITNRIMHELEHNNFKPAMVAAAYVPGMIAADFVKDMISGMGEEPPYKKDWGVVDYINQGFQRSGLTGVGQFFTEAKEDVMRGGGGYESFAGPTLGQMQKGVKAINSGDGNQIEKWIVKALPVNALYDQWLLPQAVQ